MLRRRFENQNRELGMDTSHAVEVFTITAWGEIADYQQIVADFPHVSKEWSNLSALQQKRRRWGRE